jgi:serine/threonine-protein kinase HipA
MKELIALLDGREVGVVRQDHNRLSLAYLDSWRTSPGAYPLSLSMPLAAKEHPHSAIEPFLWGLLPDNEFILARWAQRYQVSPRNPFALLSHVGEDCAGAVQFAAPDRVGEVTGAAASEIDWIDEAEIATRLRALKADESAWRQPRDAGQFSLAGAQPKTAFLFDGARWGVPAGRAPTTHIMKPPTNGFDGHAENEHLCMALARALGMPAATSQVKRFGDEIAIVVERYDRVDMRKLAAAEAARAALKSVEASGAGASSEAARAMSEAVEAAVSSSVISDFSKKFPIYRVHQEDFCQSLSVHPSRKYQNDGGPGPKEIVNLLRANAAAPRAGRKSEPDTAAGEDVQTFIDALIFNWLIGGTDAHAKNYSVLIGAGGLVRLAPLYDIASMLPYDDIDPRKAKLAMKIGDDYRLHHIGADEWRKLAAAVRVDADALIDRVRTMSANLPDALAAEVARAQADGLNNPVIGRLQTRLSARAAKLAAI